jgi:replicative DNA helicase
MSFHEEKQVLAAYLHDAALLDEYAGRLLPDTFTTEEHKQIYDTILKKSAAGKPISFETVAEALPGQRIPLQGILASFDANTCGSVGYYIDRLNDEYNKKRLYSLFDNARDCIATGSTVEREIENLKRNLDSIELPTGELKPFTFSDYRDLMLRETEGYKTGFGELDNIISLRGGSLCYVAARTSQGKTTFLVNLAIRSIKAGRPVCFISLEDRYIKLVSKSISCYGMPGTRLEYNRDVDLYFRTGKHSEPEKVETVGLSFAEYLGNSYILECNPSLTISQVESYIGKVARHFNRDVLILVDYVQLIRPDKSTGTPYKDVAAKSDCLRRAAVNYGVPVVAAAQMRRPETSKAAKKDDGKYKPPPRPSLEGLRESGDLEQDAEIVIGLRMLDDNDQGVLELSVLKNKYGKIAVSDKDCIKLDYDKAVSFIYSERDTGAADF